MNRYIRHTLNTPAAQRISFGMGIDSNPAVKNNAVVRIISGSSLMTNCNQCGCRMIVLSLCIVVSVIILSAEMVLLFYLLSLFIVLIPVFLVTIFLFCIFSLYAINGRLNDILR